MAIFLVHIFDAWLQTICNEAVPDIPLHRYKRNWPIACGPPERVDQLYVLRFLFVGYILLIKMSDSQ